MISTSLTERARDLREHGEPFVTATVVRTQRPTSAVAGNVALVHRDGTIEGFVGGVCAQHSVRLYSLMAIESGRPLLLRIMPDDETDDDTLVTEECAVDDGGTSLSGEEVASEDGTVTVRNPCLSGGALELFLEPELPAPRVLVAGDSPIVTALKSIGPELGLAVLAGIDRVDGTVTPRAGDLGLIVAAHGRDEVPVLRAGLEAGVPYVGLVASPRRGAAVLDDLRAAGVGEELLERVDSPAGLDIGARTAAEIAVSILAEVIRVRRRQRAPRRTAIAPGDEREAVSAATAVDPVCGMPIVIVPGTPAVAAGERTEYFCCEACKLAFEREHRAA